MRILVNYNKDDANYLPVLAHILQSLGISAFSTPMSLSLSDLIAKAKATSCQGIFLCNSETLEACVGASTLDDFRGSRLNYSIPVIVGNKLSHVHTVTHGQWLLEQDINKFKTIHIPPAEFSFNVLDTTDKFYDALRTLEQCLLISYDIETNCLNAPDKKSTSIVAGDSIITCCAWTGLLPSGKLVTYVLPLVNFGHTHWNSAKDYGRAIGCMQLINDLPIPKIMHNGPYDAVHSLRYHAAPSQYVLDTMGLAHAQYSELPKSLDFVASYQLYDYVQWKFESNKASKEKDIRGYWTYNAKDSWHTMRICLQQLKTLPAYATFNYKDQFKLVYPAMYMAFEGLKIDNKERERLRETRVQIVDRSLQNLKTMAANPQFNPGSWQQVHELIYDIFGAQQPTVGRTKSVSKTDEKHLEKVAEQHPLLARIVKEILDYREAKKAIGTYFDFLQLNERLLYGIDPFGTESDRFSCRSSALYCGTQVQNIPSYAKSMLVAEEGFELVEADNSQSEARCTAYCSQEEKLIAALESATHDFYKTLGTLFFGIPYEEVSDFFRNKVLKKIVHGTNYMMGPETFIVNIGVDILYKTAETMGRQITNLKAFAKELLEAYHVPFPRVREWYKEIKTEILTTGKLKSPLGHTRIFFGNIQQGSRGYKIFNSAVAHQPQNLSVKIVNKGLWRIYKEIVLTQKGEFRLKAQVHDSVLAQYRLGTRDKYIPWMKLLMDNPVVIHGRTLRIPVDAKFGPNWKNKEAYK